MIFRLKDIISGGGSILFSKVVTKAFEPNFSGFSGNFYNIFQEERGSNQLTPLIIFFQIVIHICFYTYS
jgi:hypothetical protein